ncbi:hypothetical protein [Prosthecobacter sp.]|uniref:hypothetical protein n=1 Tax=Prosthecobacter sp. TaxID=1965333 RepID=UPI003783630B
MKPSLEPLVLRSQPDVGDVHPLSPQFRAVEVRLMNGSDIEGKVLYAGPQSWQVEESFVLRPAA